MLKHSNKNVSGKASTVSQLTRSKWYPYSSVPEMWLVQWLCSDVECSPSLSLAANCQNIHNWKTTTCACLQTLTCTYVLFRLCCDYGRHTKFISTEKSTHTALLLINELKLYKGHWCTKHIALQLISLQMKPFLELNQYRNQVGQKAKWLKKFLNYSLLPNFSKFNFEKH